MKKMIPILLLAGSAILSGCGDSNDYNQVSGQQGNPNPFTPTPPVAVNDVYATDEDDAITLTAAQGVLANDQVNDQAANVTVAFPTTTAQGGTITQSANTGAFTYTPALGFTGTDSFTYTLTNSVASDTATVTIEVDAAVVAQGYFVDSANGNDTTADFDTGAPYATIQAAVLAAPVNSDIVVRPGNHTGSVTLKNGQRLLGSGSALVNAQGTVRPQLTGPVLLADGNTLDFLRIENSADDGVQGDNRDGGTITNCEIINPAGDGIQLEPAFGRWVITENVIVDAGAAGIIADGDEALASTYIINDNVIENSAFNAIGMFVNQTGSLLAQVNRNEMSENGLTVEITVTQQASLRLDLEDNMNDGDYVLFQANTGATIEVEQLSTLTQAKPSGAGNTGNVDIVLTSGSSQPTEVPDGTFNFND